ncbi:hypothetical protein EU534_02550, partial [Candidatus Heimdallarchaeota archaeon]
MKNNSAQSNKYVLDTNFFISGFEKNPSDFTIFLDIISDMGLELYVTSNILQEIRWYLRRRIKDPVQILRIPIKDIREFKDSLDDSISSPQLNDLSNIVAARDINGIVVSSDLQLVRTCESFNIPVLISSSFIFLLRNTCLKEDQNIALDRIHDVILSDEIRHSVEKRQMFDPVTRIKKIQEHAINVLQKFSQVDQISPKQETAQYHTLPEENNLIEIMNEIEFEFPNYLDKVQNGNLESLRFELEEAYI